MPSDTVAEIDPPGGAPRDDGLVFDIGMHVGQDTAFYLDLGYRVVAVEANPRLAEAGRRRFAEAIAAGRLAIVEAAICGAAPPGGRLTFYVNNRLDIWSTASPDFLSRAEKLRYADDIEAIEVEALAFPELIARHGVPAYVKIDVEGLDLDCVEALARTELRPRFLSLESDKVSLAAVDRELDVLDGLGYRRFAVMQQAMVHLAETEATRIDGARIVRRLEEGASGVFGDDIPARDWMDIEAAKRRYRQVFRGYRRFGDHAPRAMRKIARMVQNAVKRPIPGWYDTHARLD